MPTPEPEYIDPFTILLGKMRDRILTHAGVMRFVKPANVMNMEQLEAQEEREDADLPSLLIRSDGFEWRSWATNMTVTGDYRMAVLLSTAGMKEDADLCPVQWEIARAFAAITDNLGLAFVNKMTLLNATAALGSTEGGDDNWLSLFNITAELKFSRTNDINAAKPALQGA